MHRESEVLVAVLRELMARGIPAFGLHDGIIVPLSSSGLARQVMQKAAETAIGWPIPVSLKCYDSVGGQQQAPELERALPR
jgi:hypothetical protein